MLLHPVAVVCDECQATEYQMGQSINEVVHQLRMLGWQFKMSKDLCPICRDTVVKGLELVSDD